MDRRLHMIRLASDFEEKYEIRPTFQMAFFSLECTSSNPLRSAKEIKQLSLTNYRVGWACRHLVGTDQPKSSIFECPARAGAIAIRPRPTRWPCRAPKRLAMVKSSMVSNDVFLAGRNHSMLGLQR
jgi:hypothetical protein